MREIKPRLKQDASRCRHIVSGRLPALAARVGDATLTMPKRRPGGHELSRRVYDALATAIIAEYWQASCLTATHDVTTLPA